MNKYKTVLKTVSGTTVDLGYTEEADTLDEAIGKLRPAIENLLISEDGLVRINVDADEYAFIPITSVEMVRVKRVRTHARFFAV